MTPSVNTEPLYFFLKASLHIPVKGEERKKEKEKKKEGGMDMHMAKKQHGAFKLPYWLVDLPCILTFNPLLFSPLFYSSRFTEEPH